MFPKMLGRSYILYKCYVPSTNCCEQKVFTARKVGPEVRTVVHPIPYCTLFLFFVAYLPGVVGRLQRYEAQFSFLDTSNMIMRMIGFSS